MEPELDGMAVLEPHLGSISHSMNNHVGALRLNAGWISSSHPGLAEVAQEMDRSAQRLQGLGQGLSFLVRADGGRPISWCQLLDSAVELLRAMLGSKGVALRFRRFGRECAPVGAVRMAMLALLVSGISGSRCLARGDRLVVSAILSPGKARIRFRYGGPAGEGPPPSQVVGALVAGQGGRTMESEGVLDLEFSKRGG